MFIFCSNFMPRGNEDRVVGGCLSVNYMEK